MKGFRTVKLIATLAWVCLVAVLFSCSQQSSRRPKTEAELEQALSGKGPKEMAEFVFADYNCNSCHTLGKEGKFGFTSRGSQLRQQSEGCVALLTAMNVMIHVPEGERTPDEQRKYAHFQDYGCAFCHQVTPGRMGLTGIGAKLDAFHLSCPQVQQLLSQR